MALTRTRRRSPGRVRSTWPSDEATTTSPLACSPPARPPPRRAPCPSLMSRPRRRASRRSICGVRSPTRGLVHLTPGYGLGAIVLIAELSYRAATSGRDVVWTGFAQAPTDLGDIHHALAEADLVDRVTLSMAAPTAPLTEQLVALDRGISHRRDGALLVVFGETGRLHTIDERLATLAARNGVTLVVAPLDGSVGPPRPNGSPYLASIEFDVERARRRRWPAVGSASWSTIQRRRHRRARRTGTNRHDRCPRRVPRPAVLRR